MGIKCPVCAHNLYLAPAPIPETDAQARIDGECPACGIKYGGLPENWAELKGIIRPHPTLKDNLRFYLYGLGLVDWEIADAEATILNTRLMTTTAIGSWRKKHDLAPNHKRDKTCPCGKEFKASNATQKYCTHECGELFRAFNQCIEIIRKIDQ